MPKITLAAVRSAAIAIALSLASLGATSCGSEQDLPDPGSSGEVDPGGSASTLNPTACAAVARGGKVDICHVSDGDAVPVSALTVPVESCGTAHAIHEDDFFADGESGCKQAKKCKLAGKPCKADRPLDCCSMNCGIIGKKRVCL